MVRAALALMLAGSPVILSGDVDGPIFLARRQGGPQPVLEVLPLTSGAAECDGTLQGSDGETVTTTRASNAYCTKADGTMVLLSSNEPRVYRVSDEPVFLTEQAATNLLLRSQEFDNASWLKGGSIAAPPTVTADNTTGPDGTTTAERVAYPAVGSNQYSIVYQGFTATAASWTFAVYIRADSSLNHYIYFSSGTGTFHVTNCSVTTSWSRCSVTATLTAATWYVAIGTETSGGSPMSTTDARTVYIWGAQAELTPPTGVASSHVVTAGTSATRAADQINVADAELADLNGSSYCVSAKMFNINTTTTRGWYSFDSGGGAYSRAFWNGSATSHLNQVWDATLDSKTVTSTITTGAQHIRVCTQGGTLTTYLNGLATGTSAGTGDGVLDTVPTTVWLGRHLTASGYLNNYMGRFCVGPAGSCQ